MPSEIAIPFRMDGNGRVVTTSDPDSQVRLHVLALLNTLPRERAMVPGYGVDSVRMVFSDLDEEDVATQTTVMVRDAFKEWEPGVGLTTANVIPTRQGDGVAAVNVQYRRLDAADSGTVVNSNSAIIGANGSVREYVRG
jgi:phage baseplate assembly protein W